MNITDCIVSLLKSGNSVELNGVGAFEVKNRNAYFDESTNTFYPKSQTVVFRQYSEDKGNIIPIIAKKDCVDEETARQMWNNYALALKEKLQNEHIHVLPEIGELHCDNMGRYSFTSVEGLNLLCDSGVSQPLSGISTFDVNENEPDPFAVFDNPVIPADEPEESVEEPAIPETEPVDVPERETSVAPEPEPEAVPEPVVEPEPAVAPEPVSEPEPVTAPAPEPEPEPVAAPEPAKKRKIEDVLGDENPKAKGKEKNKKKKWPWILLIILLVLLLGAGAYYYFMIYQKQDKPAEQPVPTENADTLASQTVAEDTAAIDTLNEAEGEELEGEETEFEEETAETTEPETESQPEPETGIKLVDFKMNEITNPYTFDYSQIPIEDPNAVEVNRNKILGNIAARMKNFLVGKRYSTAVEPMKGKISDFIDERLTEKFGFDEFGLAKVLSYKDYVRTSCSNELQERRQIKARYEVQKEISNDLFDTYLQELIAEGAVHPDAVPVPKPVTAPVFSNSKQGFDVIAGTFSDKNSAMAMAARNRKKGCDAYVIQKGNFYYVSLGSASSQTQIERVMFQLKTWYTSNLAIKKW